MKDRPATRHAMGNIPSEEELMKTLDEHHGEPRFSLRGNYPYFKLYITICLAAPVAAYLAAMAVYSVAKGQPYPAPAVQASSGISDERMNSLVEGLVKSNEKIAQAIAAQTAAIGKNSSAISEALKAASDNPPPATSAAAAAESPSVTVQGPKIIVVKVPTSEPFDLTYEKRKLFELCAVDIDDPISGPEPFARITNVEILREVIRSFDLILNSSGDNKEISSFLKGNALKGRKYAIDQLKKSK